MSWRTCKCARCRIHALIWPAIVITIGVIFFVDPYNWDYSIGRLWPVILIVVGVIQVLAAAAPTEGHVGANPYWQNPPQTPPQVPPQAPPQR